MLTEIISVSIYLGLALWAYVAVSLLVGAGIGVPTYGSRFLWLLLIVFLPFIGLLAYVLIASPRGERLELVPSVVAGLAAGATASAVDHAFFIKATCRRVGEGVLLCAGQAQHVAAVAAIGVAAAAITLFLIRLQSRSPENQTRGRLFSRGSSG
jgi:hypothetical protein